MFLTFEEYLKSINESLTFLSLEKTQKNAFMNNLQLKQDFEAAKKEFYIQANSLLTHIQGDSFELRTYSEMTSTQLDNIIYEHINTVTSKLKFKRQGKPETDKIKEKIWLIKGRIE